MNFVYRTDVSRCTAVIKRQRLLPLPFLPLCELSDYIVHFQKLYAIVAELYALGSGAIAVL